MSVLYKALKEVEEGNRAKFKNGHKKKFSFKLVIVVVSVIFLAEFALQVKNISSRWINKNKVVGVIAQNNLITGQEAFASEKTISPKFSLEGIVYDQVAPLALINATVVKPGDLIKNLIVKEITQKSVKLSDPKYNTITVLEIE